MFDPLSTVSFATRVEQPSAALNSKRFTICFGPDIGVLHVQSFTPRNVEAGRRSSVILSTRSTHFQWPQLTTCDMLRILNCWMIILFVIMAGKCNSRYVSDICEQSFPLFFGLQFKWPCFASIKQYSTVDTDIWLLHILPLPII